MEQQSETKYHLTRVKFANSDRILNSFERRAGKDTEAIPRKISAMCVFRKT